MTVEQLAKKLRVISEEIAASANEASITSKLDTLINEIDPVKLPPPGSVVRWYFASAEQWEYGIVHEHKEGIVVDTGDFISWRNIDWEKAYVLGQDEVPVKIHELTSLNQFIVLEEYSDAKNSISAILDRVNTLLKGEDDG